MLVLWRATLVDEEERRGAPISLLRELVHHEPRYAVIVPDVAGDQLVGSCQGHACDEKVRRPAST